MSEELQFTMEKKTANRQSPCGNKNNIVTSDKKSDYFSNKNGRQKKFKDSGNGGRYQETPQQPPRPSQKYNRSYGDKRPRQRGYSDYRQGEEIAEPFGMDIDIPTSRKGKGNANYLLNFSYQDRGYHGSYSRGASSWGVRPKYSGAASHRYKKEQYLQASCQFIVQEGDYLKQAIDPDALVDWDNVQLVRKFSPQIPTCPICMDVPFAAKITRCGHVFCWACVLHYMHVAEEHKRVICPVCHAHGLEDTDSLKSVQTILVPDHKVGDEIEMKLMRKSKGSVFVCPVDDYTGQKEHLNMDDGERTMFSKLLTATWSQVQANVIEREKEALARGLISAEPEEAPFIEMAQQLLQAREKSLMSKQSVKPTESSGNLKEGRDKRQDEPASVPVDASMITVEYSDAFEDEENCATHDAPHGAEGFNPSSSEDDSSFAMQEMVQALESGGEVCEDGGAEVELGGVQLDKESQRRSSKMDDSTGTPLANLSDTLSPEEAADHLELPDLADQTSSHQQRRKGPKDTYHFYQASTGQHIYLNSLNARCLDKEYGGLENCPKTIKATIVSFERIFMTEETRKRLRYLNHIPLTTEFNVVELKIKPPVVSKETLKHFQPEFDKRRQIRQRKAREDKIRANKYEVEHRKLHGTYVAPEIQIPLDNAADFPSHLASSPSAVERQRKESTNSDIFPESGAFSDGQVSPVSCSPRPIDTCGSSPSFASFAQKLQGRSASVTSATTSSSSPPVWPRVGPSLTHSATMPDMRGRRAGLWGHSSDLDLAEDAGEEYQAPSMASAWLSSLHDLPRAPQSPPASEGKREEPSSSGKKKKKKKKEQQLLFATSMARKI